MPHLTALCALALLAAPYARADEPPPPPPAPLAVDTAPAAVRLQQPEAATPPPVATSPTLEDHPENVPASNGIDFTPARAEFGAPRSQWIGVGVGAAISSAGTDANLYGRYEYFIAQDIELFGELGAWNFAQDGRDAVGINTSLCVRYHWFHRERWTIFVDAGIGLLFSDNPVNRSGSDDGTDFNFTPRFGGGATYQLTDDGVRLELGLRWAHVSNARISGNDDNPGRDSAMLYAGLIFPF